MASTINASTSGAGGLISTADSSGVLTLQSAGTTVINVDATSGKPRITGDFSNATPANRVVFQTSTASSSTIIDVAPSTGGASSSIVLEGDSAIANGSYSQLLCSNGVETRIVSGARGTGTYVPMYFYTNNTPQMTIAVDGTITGNKGNLQLISGTAVASTSGTSIDFTGIPSWVKRITVMFSGVSTNGSSIPQIQIGSGSVTTTGYTSNCWVSNISNSTSTSGLIISGASAAGYSYNGIYTLTLLNASSNLWAGSVAMGVNTQGSSVGGGNITLSGALDRVRITTVNGTDTFDAGSVNIMYE